MKMIRDLGKLAPRLSVPAATVQKQIMLLHPASATASVSKDGVGRVQSLIGRFAQVGA